jgi:hypothetical protein
MHKNECDCCLVTLVQEALHAQEACDKLAIITDDDDVYSSDTITDTQASSSSSNNHLQQQQQQQQQQQHKHTTASSSSAAPTTVTTAVTGTGDTLLTVHRPATSSHKVRLVYLNDTPTTAVCSVAVARESWRYVANTISVTRSYKFYGFGL